jgi:DNA-binding NtrC family response regulator
MPRLSYGSVFAFAENEASPRRPSLSKATMSNALLAGFDPLTLVTLTGYLQRRGFVVETAATATKAREALRRSVDLFLLDLDLPEYDAAALADIALARRIPFAVARAPDSVPSPLLPARLAVVAKPLTAARLDALLETLLPRSGPYAPLREPMPAIVGRSPAMKRLLESLQRVGPSEATVLISGESGTGKELVAHAIHAASRRARGPFLALNCGAVAPTLIESELFGHERGSFTGAQRRHAGYFERAQGGTLFLDEITEMPLELQVRLLRVLEMRTITRVGSTDAVPVDVRVIAATNRDPQEAVQQKRLREDLLYRLSVVPLQIPPLRARAGDVRILAQHFLDLLNRAGGTAKSFNEDTLARLESYPWPGNVRELCNLVQRAYILSDDDVIDYAAMTADALPAPAPSQDFVRIHVGESLATVEQRLIEQTLRHCRTKDEAARMLGVSNKTLYNKLRRYHLARAAGTAGEAALGRTLHAS